ncbi:MAG: hypothetical protein ACNI3A_18745 [Desulfovibrio sp.]|uniref:hypothetical protein n=1 Tax=Desulfovibrio sp. 7SRBS1 TaxID=3378064 RepID=UPI003B3E05CA
MARRLGNAEQHELILNDNLSDSTMTLYYRMPTTRERLGYDNSRTVRDKKGRVENKTPETRQKYGQLILTGFKDGDFERYENGKWKPMSSNPSSPIYCPDWKDYLADHAGDVIETLAVQVFDLSVGLGEKEEDPSEDDTPDDTIDPADAEKN